MKTLKKTLCLVLALVMALSLMSVAAAADSNFDGYTDVESIGDAYVEAVDVLMGLGIVNGMSATEVGPEGYYTRAQAAKIATYLAVGPEVAEMLPAAESFTDVPATHWASKYIAYCAGKNILNGTTATTYEPEAYVTGYQFAKMVLAAAGYGANDEFVGNSWSIATAQLALRADINLFAGDAKAATNEPITRQQAMLIAFNALDLGNVTYSKLLEQYVAADVAFYGAETAKKPATVNGLTGYYYVESAEVVEVEEGVTETVYGDVISDFYSSDVLVGTYTVGTKMADIAKALGIKEDSTATYTVYGEEAAPATELLEDTTAIAGGETLNVYKTAAKNFKFFYTEETTALAVLGDEIEEGEDKGKFAWTIGEYTENAAKDAYTDGARYIVIAADGYDLAVAEAETVEGKVTATAASYVKLGADKYTKATNYATDVATLNVDVTLYLAADGTVLYMAAVSEEDVETPETLVYALAYYEKYTAAVAADKDAYGNAVPNTGSAAKYDLYIQGVNMAGEEVSYLVASNAETALGEGSEYLTFVPTMKAVEYSAETKLYSLEAPTTAALIDVDEDAISYDGEYYYNAAEYVSIIGKLTTLAVSEGTLKAADAAGDVWAVFTTAEGTDNKTVTKVFYWAEAEEEPDTTYSYSIFVPEDIEAAIETTTVQYEDEDEATTVYTVEAYIAGVKTELLVEDYNIDAGFYKYAVDECGVYELVEIDAYVADEVDNMYGNYMTIGEDFVDFDITGVKVVDLTTGGDSKVAVGEGIAFYYSVSGTTKTIECIYILAAAEVDEPEGE